MKNPGVQASLMMSSVQGRNRLSRDVAAGIPALPFLTISCLFRVALFLSLPHNDHSPRLPISLRSLRSACGKKNVDVQVQPWRAQQAPRGLVRGPRDVRDPGLQLQVHFPRPPHRFKLERSVHEARKRLRLSVVDLGIDLSVCVQTAKPGKTKRAARERGFSRGSQEFGCSRECSHVFVVSRKCCQTTSVVHLDLALNLT